MRNAVKDKVGGEGGWSKGFITEDWGGAACCFLDSHGHTDRIRWAAWASSTGPRHSLCGTPTLRNSFLSRAITRLSQALTWHHLTLSVSRHVLSVQYFVVFERHCYYIQSIFFFFTDFTIVCIICPCFITITFNLILYLFYLISYHLFKLWIHFN